MKKIALLLLSLLTLNTSLPAAETKEISLWPEGVPGLRADAVPSTEDATHVSNIHFPALTPYVLPPLPDGKLRTVIIICPGGGYARQAVEKEGYAVARWLNSLGISAFVLKYRVKEYGHPAPLRDALRAIRLVRSRADEWKVDPQHLGIMGFSAGGHLAASASTLFDDPAGRTGNALDAVSGRPDFQMLIYPVITLKDPYAHKGSRTCLLGEHPDPQLVESLSLETRVTAQTPPAFMVHSSADGAVPPQNSANYYLALRAAGVAAELHLFEQGPHGFGLLPGNGPVSDWPKLAEAWLANHQLTAPAPAAAAK